jgi:hypothetical protein
MIVLTVVLISMTVVAVGVAVVRVVAKCRSLWIAPIRLTRAELVVLHENGDVRRVDVTAAIDRLLHDGLYHVRLLTRLLTPPASDDVVNLLTHCLSQQHSRSRPACFLDVRYVLLQRLRKGQAPYRCVLPIYALSQMVHLSFAFQSSRSSMTSATLTLSCDGGVHDGARRRQLTCNVTDKVRRLTSPCGDPWRGDILRVVLDADIRELTESFALATGEALRSDSFEGLKSLEASSSGNQRLSVRVHFNRRRTEIIRL